MRGLSPRVRGNHRRPQRRQRRRRSIPACAGEPPDRSSSIKVRRVYPRVCGGTMQSIEAAIASMGLSPRVRGNHLAMRGNVMGRRSIPACAGEPASAARTRTLSKVYPRVCGGTAVKFWHFPPAFGLSPRVRGNHGQNVTCFALHRSIPACAGEPGPSGAVSTRPGVYPRVCGGTAADGLMPYDEAGLSPRVRGNPGALDLGRAADRSIPACAGEPCRC